MFDCAFATLFTPLHDPMSGPRPIVTLTPAVAPTLVGVRAGGGQPGSVPSLLDYHTLEHDHQEPLGKGRGEVGAPSRPEREGGPYGGQRIVVTALDVSVFPEQSAQPRDQRPDWLSSTECSAPEPREQSRADGGSGQINGHVPRGPGAAANQ